MFRRSCGLGLFLTFLLAVTGGPAAVAAADQPNPADKLKNLEFREIGPAVMGGRIDAFAVVENNPNIVYVGTASGGIWKSTNNGTTFEPVFDKEDVSTIGDIEIAPSDPSIVWVGTGEQNNRQSSSWGDGVYKSLDGGKTWKKMGLEATHHIGRIAIDAKNPDVVYVAALGHLWGPNPERGVYKTADGGKTWAQVLKINDDTGVVDIAVGRTGASGGKRWAPRTRARRTTAKPGLIPTPTCAWGSWARRFSTRRPGENRSPRGACAAPPAFPPGCGSIPPIQIACWPA